MRDPADNKTGELVPVKRGRGRPRKADAMTGAERQAAYRARHQGEAESRVAELEREVSSLRLSSLRRIDVTAPIAPNPVFEDQSLAKAHALCLRIMGEYFSRASEGKLNSVKWNRNNWKADAASECADAIAALDTKARHIRK